MSELESKLELIIERFRQLAAKQSDLEAALDRERTENASLKLQLAQLKEANSGSSAERYRLRYLEDQRKQLKKQMESLLTKVQSLEEAIQNEPEQD